MVDEFVWWEFRVRRRMEEGSVWTKMMDEVSTKMTNLPPPFFGFMFCFLGYQK